MKIMNIFNNEFSSLKEQFKKMYFIAAGKRKYAKTLRKP